MKIIKLLKNTKEQSKIKRRRNKRILRGIVSFIIIIILMVLVQNVGIISNIELQSQDLTYQRQMTLSPDIYIIGIDSETLQNYGKFEVWSREKIAELIEVLTEDPNNSPAVIALDINYFGYSNTDSDFRLAKAIEKAGNVVLADTATFDSNQNVLYYERAYQELLDASYSTGFSNAYFDDDGVVRHYIGEISNGEEKYLSFAEAIYKAYMEKTGQEYDLSKYRGLFYIRYSGLSNSFYGSTGVGCSVYKVLEGQYPTKTFKNAIVLIGAHTSGLRDNYYASIDKREQMYGVEIHANVIEQLLSNVYKEELTDRVSHFIIVLVFGTVSLLILLLVKNILMSVILNMILIATYFGIIEIIYTKFDLILPVIYPILTIALLSFLYIVWTHLVSEKKKKRDFSKYSKYLSNDVANAIEGEEDERLQESKKDIAVLFVDIRGFTSISERHTPEVVVNILNHYFNVTSSSIISCDGMVDKYIGDATMGLFNAIKDTDDYVYKAVCAGLKMLEGYEDFKTHLDEDLRDKVKFGIGVSCGEAIVGTIGTDDRKEYTAIGDTVNIASRIEGKAKGQELLISSDVYKRVKDRFIIEDVGNYDIKGKELQMHLYKVLGKK